MEMSIVFIYTSSKVPYGEVTFSSIIVSPVFKKMAPCPQKFSFSSAQNDILKSHVLQATSDTPIQDVQVTRGEVQGAATKRRRGMSLLLALILYYMHFRC